MENIWLAVTHLKVTPETLHYLLLAVVSLVIPMRIRTVLPSSVAALREACSAFGRQISIHRDSTSPAPLQPWLYAVHVLGVWKANLVPRGLGIRPGYFGPPSHFRATPSLVFWGLYCLLLGLACIFCFLLLLFL